MLIKGRRQHKMLMRARALTGILSLGWIWEKGLVMSFAGKDFLFVIGGIALL
jgi:hypothetical protein